MYLVIGEKPSVSQTLAKVLGAGKRQDGYLSGADCIVSWCLGHLAEYVSPEVYDSRYEKWEFSQLPILPEHWQLAVARDKKKQFEVLKKLLNRPDLEYVVNACDAGREGELIFKRVYDLSGSRLPVKRLWISSMEDGAVRDGFAHLKDGREYGNLCEAAVCRAKADWLIGMNATRAFTTKYYKRLVIGRVQTPTLAMLVERQEKIDTFVKEPFYKVTLTGDGFTAVSENFKEETEARRLAESCQGEKAVIVKVEKKQKKTMPPKLYDLTTLQREANRFFGYTAQETLQELQELYEDKLVTYPRTDSQYITEDMEQSTMELLEVLPEILPFLEGNMGYDVGRIINNDKVSDHHALLPTKESVKKGFSQLTEKQRNLYCMIGQRLAQAVSKECTYEETQITVQCAGHEFMAKGKRMTEPGFWKIATGFRASLKKSGEEETDTNKEELLEENLQEGMEFSRIQAEADRHFTSPPKAFTEDTLLMEMETAGNKEFDAETEKKGLGTPATRAAVIEKLVSSGYALRKGKQILPTVDGKALTAVIPTYLKSAAMTAEWENRLLLIERGQLDGKEFLEGVTELVKTVMEGCKEIPEEELQRFHPREQIGICPLCGSPVYEGKQNFYCSSRECSFALWKENHYLSGMRKQLDKKMAVELLTGGRTHADDFYSRKTGKLFSADLLLDTSEGRVAFQMEFPKKRGRKYKGKV